jgi:transposase
MSFHIEYLLDLPGIRVETCTQVEGKVFLGLSIVSEGIVCHHCKKSTEKLHQNRPTLVRDLSVFGRPVYLKIPRPILRTVLELRRERPSTKKSVKFESQRQKKRHSLS